MSSFVHEKSMFWWLLLWQAFALTVMSIVFWYFKSKQRLQFSKKNTPSVFITGCDSGFGKQLALQLASESPECNVIAGCLTTQGCAQLDSLLLPTLQTVQVDVTSEESVREAKRRVEKMLVNGEGLWGLVNNAGVASIPGATDWMDKRDIVGCLNVNIIGLMDVTRQFLPLVKKAKGRIVNVSSINGRFGFGNSIYCASKFAVEGFSDSIRRELASWGVQVAVIEPGFFRTSLTNNDDDRIVESFLNRFNQLERDNRALYLAYGSKFAEKNAKLLREHLSAQRLNTNLRLVTNKMQHALFSKLPRTRYACGPDAKFFWIPMAMLPTAISDWIIGLALNKSCCPEGELWAL
ncbi:retinol dehydrogenase 16-like isoform X2 [Symsagittifera roscoffensis]